MTTHQSSARQSAAEGAQQLSRRNTLNRGLTRRELLLSLAVRAADDDTPCLWVVRQEGTHTAQIAAPKPRAALDFDTEHPALTVQDEVDLGAGTCCMASVGTFAHEQVGTLEVRHDAVEICGTLRIQVVGISLNIRKNSGKPKRYQQVWWSVDGSTPELIWSGNDLRPDIDRSLDPLVIEPGGSVQLFFDFNRDPGGSDLTVTYDYRIAGQPGICSFQTLGL